MDGDIDFTPNRETFWVNYEVISKFSTLNYKKQVELMKLMPFIVPFEIRIRIINTHLDSFKEYVEQNIYHFDEDEDNYQHANSVVKMIIDRKEILDQSFNYYLNNMLHPYKRWIVTFRTEGGIVEDGVDAGGLFREYMFKLSEAAFTKNVGLFLENSYGFLIPNQESYKVSEYHLKVFEFLGFITGKAIIEDIKIYPNFANYFLNNILDIENTFSELKNYDNDFYKSLVKILEYDGDVENDFCLNFTVESKNNYGKVVTENLIENGSKIMVNNNNRFMYIKKLAAYKLHYQVKEQCESFKKGLLRVIDEETLKLLTAVNDIIN